MSETLYNDTQKDSTQKMQWARVQGFVTATVKHKSLESQKLIICQLLGNDKKPVGDPVIALDHLGARQGDTVILTSDGKDLRELLKDTTSPARWWTQGIVD
jgi:ethanolamine utilization protein EutN